MAFLNHIDLDKIQDALISRDKAACMVAESLIVAAKDSRASPELRAQAEGIYARDDIEIDDIAGASIGEGGAWVQAWVWVASPAGDDGECETCAQSIETRAFPCDECGHCDEEI